MSDPKRAVMRHFVAALAYRARKAVADAPVDFAFFAGAGKTPSAIVSHMGDLIAWSISWFSKPRWKSAEVGPWDANVTRFFTLLRELDTLLASDAQVLCYNEERMLQGPLADAMTHVGQLAMLRRMAGAATHAENFAEAPVVIGDLGDPLPPQKSA